MNVTQTATTIDTPAPTSFTCAECPFARHIDGDRYCCQVSQTASDVKRGHWEATISCYEALASAEAEKLATETAPPIAPAATEPTHAAVAATPATATLTAIKSAPSSAPALAFQTREPAALPATNSTSPVAPAPVTAGPDDEPPHRGDNGRGRVQPVPAKKLMLSLVSVKRISSDIPACNFDPNELEIAGELSLAIGGFIIPRRAGSGCQRIQSYQRPLSVSRRRERPDG